MTKTLDRPALGGDVVNERRERSGAGLREHLSEKFASNEATCKSYCPQGSHPCAKPDGHAGQHQCASHHSW